MRHVVFKEWYRKTAFREDLTNGQRTQVAFLSKIRNNSCSLRTRFETDLPGMPTLENSLRSSVPSLFWSKSPNAFWIFTVLNDKWKYTIKWEQKINVFLTYCALFGGHLHELCCDQGFIDKVSNLWSYTFLARKFSSRLPNN